MRQKFLRQCGSFLNHTNASKHECAPLSRNTNKCEPDIQEDLEMMRSRLADEARISNKYGTGSWALFRGAISELSRKGMRNRMLLVFCAFALQNMSGAAAINYYSPTLFASIGISDVSLYTGIYGLVKGEFFRSWL